MNTKIKRTSESITADFTANFSLILFLSATDPWQHFTGKKIFTTKPAGKI
jgi:hypothetical protein